MAEFFPFVLTTGQTVYLNPDHIVSMRYNGGFYVVTTTETVSPGNSAAKSVATANRTYEVKSIPFDLP